VVPGRVRLGGPEPFGEADQHHPDRRRGQVQVVGRRHARQAELWQAAVDAPHDVDPALVQPEGPHREDAEQHRGQRAGHDRGEAAKSQHQRQGGQADQQGQPVGAAEAGEQAPELLEEVAVAPFDAEQLG
jgi:hypothetical protein